MPLFLLHQTEILDSNGCISTHNDQQSKIRVRRVKIKIHEWKRLPHATKMLSKVLVEVVNKSLSEREVTSGQAIKPLCAKCIIL